MEDESECRLCGRASRMETEDEGEEGVEEGEDVRGGDAGEEEEEAAWEGSCLLCLPG